MGSVREDITGIIAALPKGTVGITDPAWANKRLQQAYPKADQILSLVCKRIEGVENPYKDEICNSYTHLKSDVYLYVIEAARDCFEEARQAIIDVIKGE